MNLLKNSIVSFALLSLLTGAVYPLAVTGLAKLLFPVQAAGSLLSQDGHNVGSELIGQPFSDPAHFWGRPSATSARPYDAAASTGSNLGPANPALLDAVRDRVKALRDADPGYAEPVPVDLVTASGSGLDPHISPAAALFQAHRVARVRGLSETEVRSLVNRSIEERTLGMLGERRVNVLKLNLALEQLAHAPRPT